MNAQFAVSDAGARRRRLATRALATAALGVAIGVALGVAVGCDGGADDGGTDYADEGGAGGRSGAAGSGGAAPRAQPAGRPDAAQSRAQTAKKRYAAPPAMQIDTAMTYHATIRTNMGEIKLELFDDAAPKTVNNFVFLAREDFYDGTIFHRVIDDFMIQGGDPTGTGGGDAGYKFEDETQGNPHKHEPFTLSMANAGPNTNGSQFFITEERATPHLNGKHTVFGRVVEGQDVVRKIATTPTGAQDRPRQEVVIEDVTIEEQGGGGGATTQPITQSATQPATQPAAGG